ALVLAVSLVGVVKSDRQSGFYADVRGAIKTVRAGIQPQDEVAYIGRSGIFSPVYVYAGKLLAHRAILVPDPWAPRSQLAAFSQAARRGARIWIIVDDAPGEAPRSAGSLLPHGYTLRAQWLLPADEDMRVLLSTSARS